MHVEGMLIACGSLGTIMCSTSILESHGRSLYYIHSSAHSGAILNCGMTHGLLLVYTAMRNLVRLSSHRHVSAGIHTTSQET